MPLSLIVSLPLSSFPEQDFFFLTFVFLLKKKINKWFQLVYPYPLWNQHWAILITTSPPYGAGCRFQYAICFPVGRRLRQKEGGGFQTALLFASCKIRVHKQWCKCLSGSTQLAHTEDYLYLQAPILANHLMYFFVYLFVLLGKKLQGWISHWLSSGSYCKGSQSKALQTELPKAFCCVFSNLYHWPVRSILTFLPQLSLHPTFTSVIAFFLCSALLFSISSWSLINPFLTTASSLPQKQNIKKIVKLTF